MLAASSRKATFEMTFQAYAPMSLLGLLAIGVSFVVALTRGSAGPLVAMPVVLCLASLLGMGLSLGLPHFLWRFVVVLVGTSVLGLGLCMAIGEMEAEWFLLIALVTGFVASATAPLRLWGLRLVRHPKMLSQAPRLKFTIRQIMSATLVVACLLGIGRVLSLEIVAFGLALSICFAGIAATSLWGTLHPEGAGTLTASAVALATAVIVYYGMEVTAIDPGILWFAITLAYAVLLILTLVAVRCCGYRLGGPPRNQLVDFRPT